MAEEAIAQSMTTRTRLSVLLISTPLLAFIVLGAVRGRAADGDQTFQHLRVFEDVVSLILNNYVEDPKVDNVMEGAMRGLADSLDPDSAYLTASEARSLDAPGCASAVPTSACARRPGLPPGGPATALRRPPGRRRRHRAAPPVLSARDRRARRLAGPEGR